MCQICLQTPCNQQCPLAEPKIAHNCTMCGEEIYTGDTYYDLNSKPICESCIYEAKMEAEE